MFIRIFINEAQALDFKNRVNGILIIRYDWDYLRNTIIKEFLIKY